MESEDTYKLYTLSDASAPKSTGIGATYDVIHPQTLKPCKTPARGWAYTEETMKSHIKDGLIHFYEDETKVPRFKRFLDTVTTEVMKSTITDFSDGKKELMRLFDGEAPFSNSKPTSLIKNFIKLTKDGIILDFFAGSGTTADAVYQANAEDGGNRKFIMVQIDEPTYQYKGDKKIANKGSEVAFNQGYMTIDEISRERIIRSSLKIQEEMSLTLPDRFDGGFKHYYVTKPSQASINDLDSFDPKSGMFMDLRGNLVAFSESGFDDMITPFSSESIGVKGGASGIDTIMTTWMIQDGYTLDRDIMKMDIDGYEALYVDQSRIYLVSSGWNANNTVSFLNSIGKFEISVQTVVIYGYSFSFESIRELEIGLKQLPKSINLVKRY